MPLHEYTGRARFSAARSALHHAHFVNHLMAFLNCANITCVRDLDITVFGMIPKKVGSKAKEMNALIFPLTGADSPPGEFLIIINQRDEDWHIWNLHVVTVPPGTKPTSQTHADTVVQDLLPYVMGIEEFCIGSWILITEKRGMDQHWHVALAECSITDLHQPHKFRFFQLAAAIAQHQKP